MRPTEFQREADAFMASGRLSFGHRLLAPLRRQRDEEPVARRYRAVARALRLAAGTLRDFTLNAFMESEARSQRELALGTLHRIHDVWASESSIHYNVKLGKS